MGCICLVRRVLVLRCGLAGVVWYPYAGWSSASACIRLPHHPSQSNTDHEITQQISRKLLRMDVLTSETCWALNNEIIKQVTSSWSLYIQLVLLSFKTKHFISTSHCPLPCRSTSKPLTAPLSGTYTTCSRHVYLNLQRVCSVFQHRIVCVH